MQDEEQEHLRQANLSLRQSLDQLIHLRRGSAPIASARSLESLFKAIADAIPQALPALALEGIFRRPDSPTLYQLRHFYEDVSPAPAVPEETLAWAKERNVQAALPLPQGGGAVFCPLYLEQQKLGHLLVYTRNDFAYYTETVALALDLLSEQAAATALALWREARLEEENHRLRASQSLLSHLMDSLEAPLLALDASGHLLLANTAANPFFGRQLGTLRGQHYQVVFPAPVVEAISEAFLQVQKGKPGARQPVRFANFRGEIRTLVFSSYPLPLPESRSTGMVLLGQPS